MNRYRGQPLRRSPALLPARADQRPLGLSPDVNSPEDCLRLAKSRASGPTRPARLHTPRATLAGRAGQTGAQLKPLFEARKDFVLSSAVLHGDETTVKLLDPGAGKTKTAYMWAYV